MTASKNNKLRVLVLHTSVGHGIKITAENIAAELNADKRFIARVADIYQVHPGPIVNFFEKIYLRFTETFPFIWGWLYSDLVATLTMPFRLPLAAFRYKKIWGLISEFRPDIVVSTETVPSGIVAYLKKSGRFRGRLVIAFSDYHLHRFWLYREADLYLCSITEQRDELLRLGVPERAIAVTGMITSKKYLRQIPRAEAQKTFKLQSKLPAVILTGGRRGLMASRSVLDKLFSSPYPFQVVIIAGKNQDLRTKLQSMPTNQLHPMIVLGYISNLELLMQASDMIISKAGGPTIAEAATIGLPIILTDVHPGHEWKNMKYLTANRIANYGKNPAAVLTLVEKILSKALPLDPKAAQTKILQPPGSVSVVEALSSLKLELSRANK